MEVERSLWPQVRVFGGTPQPRPSPAHSPAHSQGPVAERSRGGAARDRTCVEPRVSVAVCGK